LCCRTDSRSSLSNGIQDETQTGQFTGAATELPAVVASSDRRPFLLGQQNGGQQDSEHSDIVASGKRMVNSDIQIAKFFHHSPTRQVVALRVPIAVIARSAVQS
jgi:hypothetical protein